MKKLFLLLAIIGLAACYNDMAIGTTPESLTQWVHEYVTYTSDGEWPSDQFQTPQKTLELATGDCDDYAILLMWLMYQELGIKSEFVVLDTGTGYHATVAWEGTWYDATGGFTVAEADYVDQVVLRYGYDRIMFTCVFFSLDEE